VPQMIADAGERRRVEAMLAEAREGGDRMRSIVRDLLTMARNDVGPPGPVSVAAAVDAAIKLSGPTIGERARVVRRDRGGPLVLGNPARLGQIFLNLLINAGDAFDGPGVDQVIDVEVGGDEGDAVITVSDNGRGIAPDTLSRIFEPFFTTKPVGVGTGLGLSICQRIVSSLGGEIQVESELGKGSTFRVVLPSTTRAPRIDTETAAAISAARRGRVLVVDDEPLIGTVVRRTLSSIHDVTIASSTRDALDRIVRGERFDVILCDLMMPQQTGMDLHAELERTAPDQAERMVFMTGGAFTPRARAFLDAHPNRLLEKPFDGDRLRGLVAERMR